MNILFLSLSQFETIEVRGIYSDLMRELVSRGHDVYIAWPTERRFGKHTYIIKENHCQILKIRTFNLRKTNIIEKGIGMISLEYQFNKAIRKYWGNINFDLILYSTPPITFNRIIEKIKKRCGCRSYLMLKDIFPQNAVDLGMMNKDGFLYKMFRKKEKRLYKISDRIGCMSPANREYILKHNPEVDPNKVEICPNAIEPVKNPELSAAEKIQLLHKWQIPTDKTLFIYGGNLGKPQGINFLIDVVQANEQRNDSFIIIVGGGTEYPKIKKWFDNNVPTNSKLISFLPKDEYDKLISVCDVGLIFLDSRFTIPNFPSRLLCYLENSMPILLATDETTDMGRLAEEKGFGLWCKSGDLNTFMKNMDKLLTSPDLHKMGKIGYQVLIDNFTVDKPASIIENN